MAGGDILLNERFWQKTYADPQAMDGTIKLKTETSFRRTSFYARIVVNINCKGIQARLATAFR